MRIVYDGIWWARAFAAWAQENPTEFYKIAARLIPAEINAKVDNKTTTVIVDRWRVVKTLREPDRAMLPAPAAAH